MTATGAPTPGDAVWEPWQPQVGQRVRIRLTGECDVKFQAQCVKTREPRGVPALHYLEVNGAEGEIVKSFPLGKEKISGHRFEVVFDQPVVIPGICRLHGVVVSASELIAISARPGAADGEVG